MIMLVCMDCGWKSEPYPIGTAFAGPGGQLGCPKCTEKRINKNIEVYGHVRSMTLKEYEKWLNTIISEDKYVEFLL